MSQSLKYSETLSGPTLNALKLCYENTEGMLSFEESMLLYSLAKEVRTGCIIEIGSYRGGSSVFLGRGSLDGAQPPVYAIDPHKNFVGVLGGVFGPKDRTSFFKAMLNNGCSEIVSLINLSSELFSSQWKEPVSLLWIDGDHSYSGVKRDFDCWMPHLTDAALIAFDDAIDSNLGPRILINELIVSNQFEEIMGVGKVAVIRRYTSKKS